MIPRILRHHQHDIVIACQASMLKSIVQHMHPRTESRLRKTTSLITIFAHHYWHLQSSRNQQRLITEIPRQPAGINQQHSTRPASVAT